MDEMQYEHFDWPEGMEGIPVASATQKIGYMNAPLGGAILNPGNTIERDVSGSRAGWIPVWHEDKCIHCAMCETACPDFCFTFEQGIDNKGKEGMVNRGIDYQYCKGCLKCVTVCPADALTKEKEADFDVDKIRRAKTF